MKYLGIGQRVMIDERGTETNPAAFTSMGTFSPPRKRTGTVSEVTMDGTYLVDTDDGNVELHTQRSVFAVVT